MENRNVVIEIKGWEVGERESVVFWFRRSAVIEKGHDEKLRRDIEKTVNANASTDRNTNAPIKSQTR